MINVSNEFKTAMKQPIKELQAYISSGDIKITDADDLISFKISCDSGMCKSAMRKLEATYLGETNLLGQWVRVAFGVKLSDGTFEYLDYGSFLVTEITYTKDKGTTEITGYDKMINSMKNYTKLEIEYPTTLLDYTKVLCEACGLELGNDIFGTNLLDLSKCTLSNCILNKDNSITSNINEHYYSVIETTQFNELLMKNKGNSLTFSIGTIITDARISIVIFGTREDGTTNQEVTISNASEVSMVIAEDFTEITNLQLRFNRYATVFTDTTTTIPYAQLEMGTKATSYRLYNTINDYPVTQDLWENIDGITYRDIFVQIAQVTTSTCMISNDDKIYFKPLTATGESLTYDNLFKLKLEPIYGEINHVTIGRDPIVGEDVFLKDDDSIATNGSTEYRISNNEIVDKDRENAIEPIFNAFKGISYYPFEVTTEGLGWYEIGDSFDIVNDVEDVFNTSLFNFSISVAGSLKETLKTVAETKAQSQYQYASSISKRIKNTEIIVNKQEGTIEQLVKDVQEEDGIVNEKFTQVYQDIDNIVNSVQNSGGNNLLKNSVMFAYDSENNPSNWVIDVACKNLAPTESTDWVLGQYTMHGQIEEYENRIRLNYLIPVKPNTDYYFNTFDSESQFVLRSYHADRTFHGSIGAVANDGVYTTTYKTHYLGVTIYRPSDSDTDLITEITNGTIKPFICLNSETDKTFEAHVKGSININANSESLNNGCLSGHSFTLTDKIARQEVTVSNDLTYTFSTRIKKNTTGTCYVKIYNANEEYIIEIPSGTNAFYSEYELKELKPKDNYYIVEFYGSADSDTTFTDNMLATGNLKSQWTQANGEIMNTQVNFNVDGILVKSSIYLGDYTIMSPLEFAGYSNINGTITKVFSLNKDVTFVKKLEADDEIKMVPIKIVPVTSGDMQGWAFVPST